MYNNNHGMKISMTKQAICIEIYKNHSLYEPFINLKNIGATTSISKTSSDDTTPKNEGMYYAPKTRWTALMFIAQNCVQVVHVKSEQSGTHIITLTELLILSSTLPPFITREISDYIRSLKYNLVNYGAPIFIGTQQSELFGNVVAQYLELKNNIRIGDRINVEGTNDHILWNGSKFSIESHCEKNT
jgi:hypothetical protein